MISSIGDTSSSAVPWNSLDYSSSGAWSDASKRKSMPAVATSTRSEGIMNKPQRVEITVTLTDTEAWQFAQFLKRACFSDYRGHATSEADAYQIIDAGERIRRALAEKGYAPR
jgi:hypothetical protein